MDFYGKVLLEESKHSVTIDPLSSKVYMEWPLSKVAQSGGTDTTRVFVVAELAGADALISRNLSYIAPTKEIHLPTAHLNVELEAAKTDNAPKGSGSLPSANRYEVRISSPVLARDVYLSFGSIDAKLSDNYFDVLPGEKAEVIVTTNASLAELQAQMKMISLTDAFAVSNQPATVTAAH
jgi:beta-mannosidase